MASKTDTIFGLGRRKRAIAQVFMRQGSGNITVNDKKLEEYFDKEILILKVKQPLVLTNNEKTFDIKITAKGGGITGQAEAIRLGIARALVKYDENLKKALKVEGYLTRDAREVERKKYGLAKARKRYQFSKR